MASRRRAREIALQALYAVDVGGEDAPGEALAGLVALLSGDPDGRAPEAGEVAFARRLVEGATERREEIDALIEAASLHWRLRRMPTVDRNILRMATFELIGCPDVPASVAINEAVELAKRYGDRDSRAFVNGILDRIASETGRGGRRHRRR